MKKIPGAPDKQTQSAKERRQHELAACEAELKALLDRYDAFLSGSLIMALAADGAPRYQFQIAVAGR